MRKVWLALMGAAERAYRDAGGHANHDNPADPYMTVLGYFNSLRELGGARRILEEEVQNTIKQYGERRWRDESVSEGLFRDRASFSDVIEMTSRSVIQNDSQPRNSGGVSSTGWRSDFPAERAAPPEAPANGRAFDPEYYSLPNRINRNQPQTAPLSRRGRGTTQKAGQVRQRRRRDAHGRNRRALRLGSRGLPSVPPLRRRPTMKPWITLFVTAVVTFTAACTDELPSLHDAVKEGGIAAVTELLDRGADPNARTEGGMTPLHRAAWGGKAEVVALLLDRGANLNVLDKFRATPLHLAVGHAEVVALLLDRGADPNARTEGGETPLHGAASVGKAEVVALLLDRGANIDARDRHRAGATPLYLAAARGEAEVVALLLDRGADPNARTDNAETSLHTAVAFYYPDDYPEVAALLLDRGADPNARDWIGETPLHRAAMFGRAEYAALLLDQGADPNARNKIEKTPLDIAVADGHTEIADLLRRRGGR